MLNKVASVNSIGCVFSLITPAKLTLDGDRMSTSEYRRSPNYIRRKPFIERGHAIVDLLVGGCRSAVRDELRSRMGVILFECIYFHSNVLDPMSNRQDTNDLRRLCLHNQ